MMKIRGKVSTLNKKKLMRMNYWNLRDLMKNIDTVKKLINSVIFLSSVNMKDFFNIRCEIVND